MEKNGLVAMKMLNVKIFDNDVDYEIDGGIFSLFIKKLY